MPKYSRRPSRFERAPGCEVKYVVPKGPERPPKGSPRAPKGNQRDPKGGPEEAEGKK